VLVEVFWLGKVPDDHKESEESIGSGREWTRVKESEESEESEE
jgi:hypothetical protein